MSASLFAATADKVPHAGKVGVPGGLYHAFRLGIVHLGEADNRLRDEKHATGIRRMEPIADAAGSTTAYQVLCDET